MFSNIPKKYRILCAGGFSLIDNLQNENKKLKNQQKEFIEYLDDLNIFGAISVKEIIDKYKEIIGDDNNG